MRRALTLTLVLALVLTACATTTRLTVGEALDALAQAFLQTADTYRQAHDQGLVSDQEYRAFVEFGMAFQNAWGRAYQLWLAGENPAHVRAMIDSLRQELTLWALRLAKAKES
jgi:outer membrane biogenesis lipoprotein LolB